VVSPPRSTRSHLALLCLGLLVLSILVSLRQWPPFKPQGRDSGIFAYTAQVIVDGGLPYLDAWDNKTPGVYYVNAAALLLFGDSRWTLWGLQVGTFFLTGLLFWWLLVRVYGRPRLAMVGTLIFMFQAHHFVLVGSGNYSETYALVPQLVCLLAGYRFLRGPDWRWALLTGLSAGLIFLIRQNTIGAPLMLLPALWLGHHPLWRDRRRLLAGLAVMGASGLGVLVLVVVYFGARGGLSQMLDAVFVAPSAYHSWISGRSPLVWETLITTFGSQSFTTTMLPLMPLALAGAVIALREIRRQPERSRPEADVGTFHVWTLLVFVCDLVLANATDRAYDHYIITPMLSFVLLIVLSLARIARLKRRAQRRVTFAVGAYLTLLFGLLYWLMLGLDLAAESDPLGEPWPHPATNYVQDHTTADDTVLVWGAASEILFQADRRSASRFHYDYPLLVPDYATDDDVQTFLDDLRANQPPLIVDVSGYFNLASPPLDAGWRAEWQADPDHPQSRDLTPVFDFVAAHCHVEHQTEEFWVYRCQY
jgi:hypothetical protein